MNGMGGGHLAIFVSSRRFISWLGIAMGTMAVTETASIGASVPWQPAPDEVYSQESGWQVTTAGPIRTLAVFEGGLFAGSENGLSRLVADQLKPVPALRTPVTRLVATSDSLWAIGKPGLHRLRDGRWKKVSADPVTDVTEHLGEVVVSLERRLAGVEGDKLEPLVDSEGPFAIHRILSHCETLYVQGPGRLTFFDGVRIGGRNVYNWSSDEAWDWGALPSRRITDAVSLGGTLYLATDRGLGVLRGMSLTSLRGGQGLCYVDYKSGIRTFSPRETGPMRWDHWTMQADGGSGGRDVVEPGAWLLAYWMGRFHGFIDAPETTDPEVLTVDRNRHHSFGARPYAGPQWPE